MKCRKCRKNQATFYISSARIDESNRIGFCDACAEEAGVLSMLTRVESILHGYGIRRNCAADMESDDIPIEFAEECGFCGMDLQTFERELLIGCDNCCNIFSSLLYNFISLLSSEPLDAGMVSLYPGKPPAVFLYKKKAADITSKLKKELKNERYIDAQSMKMSLAKSEEYIAARRPSADVSAKPAKPCSAVASAKSRKYLKEKKTVAESVDSIWLQTRIEFRRNLSDYVFPARMDETGRRVIKAFCAGALGPGYEFVDVDSFSPLDKLSFEARHYGRKLSSGATVAFKRDKDTMLLLNDQEHFIFDYCGGRLSAEKSIQAARAELSIFEKKADIAYSGRFGYVTSSPKNFGAAASVSVLMHLPFSLAHGLIELYPAKADRAGVRFEPFCGQNIERHGFFRISSAPVFGADERKIIERVFEFAMHLEKEEIRARHELQDSEEKHLRKLMAQVLRHSTHSYRLSYTDALRLFSFLSIGAELGEPGLAKLSPSAVIPGLASPCIMGDDRKLYTVNECEKRRADMFAELVEKCVNPLLSSHRAERSESVKSEIS